MTNTSGRTELESLLDVGRPAPTLLELHEILDTKCPITSHPLFQRLGEGPVDLEALWVLLANFRICISANFSRWAANAAARVDSLPIRSYLARQLNDEMGNGNVERAHAILVDRTMDGLARFRPSGTDVELLAPGRRGAQVAEEIFAAADVYESLGAIIIGEKTGEQLDRCLGKLFRRQERIASEHLEWLWIHEQIDVEHSAASRDVMRHIPAHGLEPAAEGARRLVLETWSFFSDVQSVCRG